VLGTVLAHRLPRATTHSIATPGDATGRKASKVINLDEVGAFALAPTDRGVEARFGIYLPGIDPRDGYEVIVRVIHQDDRFVPEILPMNFPLAPAVDSPNNLWQTTVTIPIQPGTSFGQPGTYLYRYQLRRTNPGSGSPQIVTLWFTDPFARATDDVGELSAFSTPGTEAPFTWSDETWKVPELADLVVYELHVEEFNDTFDGAIARLTYLKSLGVSCLELMPVTSLKLDFDWGYGPLHYFAPNERWGGAGGLKRLVDACHHAGIAVILDVVYQHVDPTFPYHLVYADANLPSPMIGNVGPFGPQIDYSKEFARIYVQAANRHWLDEYHVDGFRYDEVTDLYDGPTGVAYAKMAYDAYGESFAYPRFTPSGGTTSGEYSRIIQCAEALNRPQEILRTTYSNSTWQDGLLNKAEDMATHGYVDDDFAHLLDATFSGYPLTRTVQDVGNQPVEMPVAPFQYLESHDHSQLIAYVGTRPGDAPFAERSKFYKLQPFAIALFTSQGIPMLWQGQEFADNYVLPASGDARIHFRRGVHWEYFYDELGAPLVRLYRILGKLRRNCPALRSRESFYYNSYSRTANGVIAYQRRSTPAKQIAMVFLNFSDQSQTISVPFLEAGDYQELIDRQAKIAVATTNQMIDVTVPSNYGCIFVK
jgi:maltooligosyltrehalose trehalohydrolase